MSELPVDEKDAPEGYYATGDVGRGCMKGREVVMSSSYWKENIRLRDQRIQELERKLKSTENQREYVLDALERIASIVPGQHDGGGFVFDHYDHEGEYIGSENVDPTWVVFEMVEVATHTLATVEDVQ